MPIDTTIHVHDETLTLICATCDITGTRRNRIIITLLKKAMINSGKKYVTGSAIRYQDRDPNKRWHTIHIRFRDDDADYFKDLRNFLKQSVSLILAIAIRDYLADLVNKSIRDDETDNYPFFGYRLSQMEYKGIFIWIIYWGTPPTPEINITH